MIARDFPLAGSLLVCHARTVCQCGLCVKGCERPDRQRALSVGFTGREGDGGWSPNLHMQSPLAGSKGFTAVRENKKTMGWGAGGWKAAEGGCIPFVRM